MANGGSMTGRRRGEPDGNGAVDSAAATVRGKVEPGQRCGTLVGAGRWESGS